MELRKNIQKIYFGNEPFKVAQTLGRSSEKNFVLQWNSKKRNSEIKLLKKTYSGERFCKDTPKGYTANVLQK